MFGCISKLGDKENKEKENIIKKEIVEWIELLVSNVGMQSDDAVEYFEVLQSKQTAVGLNKETTQVVTKLVSG